MYMKNEKLENSWVEAVGGPRSSYRGSVNETQCYFVFKFIVLQGLPHSYWSLGRRKGTQDGGMSWV